MEEEIIGAIKIKDGLFIGDEFAAKDLEFIITNKVTHVINTAGQQLANFWETVGVGYLTFDWVESDTQRLFDAHDEVINEIYNFIEGAAKAGESVLVHSVRGQSRSCCVIAAYFMKRYHWTLYKTLEFLNSRRPDLEIRANFFHQLTNLESRLAKSVGGQVSTNWNDITDAKDGEEIVLRNTFLNAKNAPLDQQLMHPFARVLDLKQKICWNDFTHHRASSAGKRDDCKKQKPKTVVKSVLKGSKKTFKFDTGEEVKETPARSSLRLNTATKQNQGSNSQLEGGVLNPADIQAYNSKPAAYASGSGKFIDLNEKPKQRDVGSMMRSSSASAFERENNQSANLSASSEKHQRTLTETKNYPPSVVTAKSRVAVSQQRPDSSKKVRNDSYDKSAKENDSGMIHGSAKPLHKSTIAGEKSEEPNSLSYLANRQLKLALEKKVLRESQQLEMKEDEEKATAPKEKKSYSTQFDQFMKRVQPSKSRESNSVSPMVRRGESPTLKKGKEKEPESVYAKALAKSAVSRPKAESSQNHLNYLNGLFPSTYLSAMNGDKKAVQLKSQQRPSDTSIATSMQSQNGSNQRFRMQNYLSNDPKEANPISDGHKSSSFLSSSEVQSSSTKNSSSSSNGTHIFGQKNFPVRANYEILDRPMSASNKVSHQLMGNESFSRAKDPTSYTLRPGTASSQLRSFSPTVKSSKHSRKESPLAGDNGTMRARQRSSSPAQTITYGNLFLGTGASKPRWK